MYSEAVIFFITIFLLITSVTCHKQKSGKPKILATLDEKYNTPYGCTLSEGEDIIMSVPNLNNSALVKQGVIKTTFVVPNAVIWRGNTIYVSETVLVPPTKEGAMGAIYAILMDE